MKGIVITSVAWNQVNRSAQGSGSILLGSDAGIIYELSLENGKENVFKKLYDLSAFDREQLDDGSQSVSGLHVELFPQAGKQEAKYFVMAATPTRHYQFVGGPTFEMLFKTPPYNSNPPFKEMPGDLGYSELHFYPCPEEPLVQRFAWLTKPCIVYGGVVLESQTSGEDVLHNQNRFIYPTEKGLEKVRKVPVSFGLTRYHFVLLYKDSVQVVNPLSKTIVFTQSGFGENNARHGKFVGVASDPERNAIFLISEKSILKLRIQHEEQNMWKVYLAQRQFKAAKDICAQSAHVNKVLMVEADYRFECGAYEEAAQIYAQSPKSFEEVALKFVKIKERDALMTFLGEKLGCMKKSAHMQRTLICTWLTELYLDKLNTLKGPEAAKAYKEHLERFRKFLSEHREDLDRDGGATAENLISSHGRIEELLYFASQIHDYPLLINNHIQRGEWTDALKVMSKQQDEETFYKHSPILIRHEPGLTVAEWLKFPALEVKKLIPAMMQYDPKRAKGVSHHVLKYLQQKVSGGLSYQDPAVHNYLLSLLVEEAEGETDLLYFLDTSDYIDRKYALRLCLAHGKKQAAIRLYSDMALYQDAVESALQWGDLDLAKINAEKATESEEKKKLWLLVAEYVFAHAAKNHDGIKSAISEVRGCSLLKIEDILPFFPEETVIDDFREEICESLSEYNQNIDLLKQEMDTLSTSSRKIQQDIEDLPNRYGFVYGDQKCSISNQCCIGQEFFLFPCGHAFLYSCLQSEMPKHLSALDQRRLTELQQEFAVCPDDEEKARLQEDIDDILAGECMLCGRVMISCVDKRLDQDLTSEQSEWNL